MKKHIFKEGNIKYFFPEIPHEEDKFFEASKERIINLYPLFDFDKLDNTDYYYIYKAFGGNETNLTKEEVEESIRNILNGNWDNVIDENYLTLGIPDKSLESDIFWDTENDIIIARGRRNLRLVAIELFIRTIPGEKRTPENEMKHISVATDCELIRKTCLSDEWFIQEALEETANNQRTR